MTLRVRHIHISVSFRIFVKGGQKYVNCNFGGARNRGAKRHVTHKVGHMLGGSGGMLPQKILRFFYPLKSVFLQYEQQFTQLCSITF